ncbi:hypothetical protein ACFQWC_18085 [Rossellomorea sp. GCM10028870]
MNGIDRESQIYCSSNCIKSNGADHPATILKKIRHGGSIILKED